MNNQTLFNALGFKWDRSNIPSIIPTYTVEAACFRFMRNLPEFIWSAAVLEGNPFTFNEVKTLLDGITVGGHRIDDQEQILNLNASTRHLISLVRSGEFELSKQNFDSIHKLVARNEALEWGVFRGEGEEKNYTPYVALGELGQYNPIPTEDNAVTLNKVFDEGLEKLKTLPVFERATAFFLFGALQQFYFDGNKRSSRLMMCGELLANGIAGISIPAQKKEEFNEKMQDFYINKDATLMMDFLVRCHPDVELIRKLNEAEQDIERP
ncbi:Fic family protein [Oligella urethralis]|uniref:Fic family protein n=1 Tax=Oligella urethralis TaxID=90245 RepID=UPI00242F58A8|nr:cell filamentation protein Fic [Oligella urethralis]